MKWKGMAILYGVILSLSVITVVILFPARDDQAFTCLAQHLVHKWGVVRGHEVGAHAWPLAPWLCGWVVGLIMAAASGFGIVRLSQTARKELMQST